MAITRSQIVDTLDVGLNEIWLDGLKGWDEEYAKIFVVGSSKKQLEKDSYLSGFGNFPEKTEGSPAQYDSLYPGISTNFVPKTYALGYEITEEAVEDNQYEPETFNKFPEALKRSAISTVEVVSANVFNNGFSTNGFDGVPLFSVNHLLLGGSTQANTPATQADLSVSSLQAGLQALEDQVDERGKKIASSQAVLLVVPTGNMWTSEELLKSTQKPYVANNEINAIRMKDLTYMVWHYLTDSDSWFLLASKDVLKIKFFWRIKLGDLRRGTDFDSTNLKHLGRMRFAVGYSHYQGTYGSSGA
ncbi:MAG: hypothetical protein FJ150_02730 [Euryarchaeota archaeon]|nr:hypothetical protein [Euryarchaeota archaeon]